MQLKEVKNGGKSSLILQNSELDSRLMKSRSCSKRYSLCSEVGNAGWSFSQELLLDSSALLAVSGDAMCLWGVTWSSEGWSDFEGR